MAGKPNALIVGSKRSPVGKFGGPLSRLKATVLAGIMIESALSDCGIGKDDVDEVVMGMAIQAGAGPNPARLASLAAGIPSHVPAITVNGQCISGMKAVEIACDRILLGKARVVVAGGVESLSRVPYLLEGTRRGSGPGDLTLYDGIYRDSLMDPTCGCHLGLTVEDLAVEYGVTRSEVDKFAFQSHQRAVRARADLAEEIAPVEVPSSHGGAGITVQFDEPVRLDSSLEGLATLRPAYPRGNLITSGNSPGLTDGAIAVVVVSSEMVADRGLKTLGRIQAAVTTAVDPARMALGPVVAIKALLKKTGLRLSDIRLFEINEAFGAQMCICQRELQIPEDRLNVNGGAIALGHPFGFTGARLVTTLLYELRRRGGGRGIAATCSGGGPAMAVLVESVPLQV